MAKARLAFGLCCLVAAIIAVPQLASAGNRGNFAVNCLYSHTQMDDPIVFPDQPGASHMHDFFGNVTTDAFSTPASLLATTSTCKDSLDHSGYWTPQTSMNGVPIVPIKVENYWINTFGDGAVEVPPVGLELVAGNSHATAEQAITIVHYNCGSGSNPPFTSPYSTKPYDCTTYMAKGSDGVVETINFPTCWDGVLPVGNDTADLAYQTPPGGPCPGGFSHHLPQLSVRVHTGLVNPLNKNGSIGLTLASGAYYTLHGDFMSGWVQTELALEVANCLNKHVNCGLIKK